MKCRCSLEEGDSRCPIHPSCNGCGEAIGETDDIWCSACFVANDGIAVPPDDRAALVALAASLSCSYLTDEANAGLAVIKRIIREAK